jgi:hypothetical protein
MDQPRRPPGTPLANQFLDRLSPAADEVDLNELLSDDKHDPDGTDWFPPGPQSARQAVAFWMTVDAPDRVPRQLHQAHTQIRRYCLFHIETVPEIPRPDLRAALRVARLYSCAAQLFERKRSRNELCRFTSERHQTLLSPRLIDHFKLDEAERAIADSPEEREDAKEDQKTYDTAVEIRNLLYGLPDFILSDFAEYYRCRWQKPQGLLGNRDCPALGSPAGSATSA